MMEKGSYVDDVVTIVVMEARHEKWASTMRMKKSHEAGLCGACQEQEIEQPSRKTIQRREKDKNG